MLLLSFILVPTHPSLVPEVLGEQLWIFSCEFFIDGLYQVNKLSCISSLLSVFIKKGVLDFVDAFPVPI